MTESNDRQASLDGLRALIDFLEANPDVPINPQHVLHYSASATPNFPDEAEARAEIDRVADLLGVEPAEDDGHYSTGRRFGPIEYKAAAISAEAMRRYAPRAAEADALEPDEAVA